MSHDIALGRTVQWGDQEIARKDVGAISMGDIFEPPFVSVVVPHFNDLARLDRCLAALKGQSYPSERMETIVADNGSPQPLSELLAAIGGRAHLVRVAERGAGLARNGGVAVARGTVLAFTDSDCLPQPSWVEAGVRALGDNDFVGGMMVVLVQDEGAVTATEAFERVFAFKNDRYIAHEGFSVTANLFCRREVFERVGGFRVGVSEDVDWCRRASAAGFRLGYAAAAAVGHPARRTWNELIAKWRRMNQEKYALIRPGLVGQAGWLVRSLALPPSAFVHAGVVMTTPTLSGLRQRLGAGIILHRIRLWRGLHAISLLFNASRA